MPGSQLPSLGLCSIPRHFGCHLPKTGGAHRGLSPGRMRRAGADVTLEMWPSGWEGTTPASPKTALSHRQDRARKDAQDICSPSRCPPGQDCFPVCEGTLSSCSSAQQSGLCCATRRKQGMMCWVCKRTFAEGRKASLQQNKPQTQTGNKRSFQFPWPTAMLMLIFHPSSLPPRSAPQLGFLPGHRSLSSLRRRGTCLSDGVYKAPTASASSRAGREAAFLMSSCLIYNLLSGQSTRAPSVSDF